MKMGRGVLCGILVALCVLAMSCKSGSIEEDIKLICGAASVAQVAGVPNAEKKGALQGYVNTNVKTDEGRAFATALFAMEPKDQLVKLEEGMKTASIEAGGCPTHALITQLVASQQ